jgi:hypothetical protein
MELQAIKKLAQACFSSHPTIVLGSGASMPHQLPSMTDLQQHLSASIQAAEGAEDDQWTMVRTALGLGDHLEEALTGKNLPASLTKKIVEQTWKCVNKADHALFLRALSHVEEFPLGRLLAALSVSSNPTIDIVTSNYDRVAEYACNAHGLLYSAGFTPGYLQSREGADQISFQRGRTPSKTIRIWKVHGSLDWFEREGGEAFAAPIFEIPANAVRPLIVTPGLYKFEQAHYEPFRSIMTGADAAFSRATAFLCIGFGFRDAHIEPKLFERCRTANVPVAVIARSLTPEARKFLRTRAGTKYIGLEATEAGTRIFTTETPDGVVVDDPEMWSLNGFLKMTT